VHGTFAGALDLRRFLWLLRRVAAAQVPDEVVYVGELLLEIPLIRLETSKQLLPVRERPAEVQPSAAMVPVVHVHLLSARS
jgi:hypothetical protein